MGVFFFFFFYGRVYHHLLEGLDSTRRLNGVFIVTFTTGLISARSLRGERNNDCRKTNRHIYADTHSLQGGAAPVRHATLTVPPLRFPPLDIQNSGWMTCWLEGLSNLHFTRMFCKCIP